MKKIALHGALDVNNFGNVLLAKIYSDWIVAAGAIPVMPSSIHSVREQITAAIDGSYYKADAIIYIGGGYFGEPPRRYLGRWRWGFRMVKKHILSTLPSILRGNPFSIIGVGCGPVTNWLGRLAICLLCRDAATVAVRDRESADFLRSLGVKNTVHVTADAALALSGEQLSTEAYAAADRIRSRLAGRLVILHLDKQAASDQAWAILISGIRSWIAASGYSFLAITDQHSTPVVQQQLEDYRNNFGNLNKLEIYGYAGMQDIIGVLSAADIIVTTKLHVVIVGTALSRQVLAFPAHSKTIRFYRQTGLDANCLPHTDWAEETIASAIARADRLVGQTVKLHEEVLAMATQNRVFVRQFVNEIA